MVGRDFVPRTGLCVALYKGTRPGWLGLYNRAVRLLDRGPYSHCELVFSDGVSCGASYMDGGVRLKRIGYTTLGNWDFLPVPDPTGEREQQARGWAYGHKGKGYDLWGNVRFLSNLIRDDSDKWFCSEAIMAMLGFKEPYRYGPSGMVAVIAGMFGTQVLERLVENKGKP